MIVRCGRCGTKNRVPADRLGQVGKCGNCKGPIEAPPLPGHPLEVSGAELDDLLISYPVPVLIDFFSNTCGPCISLGPILERLAAERRGRIVVAKVNIEMNPQAAVRFGVRGVPVLLMTRDGSEVDRIVGAPSEADTFRWVDRHL